MSSRDFHDLHDLARQQGLRMAEIRDDAGNAAVLLQVMSPEEEELDCAAMAHAIEHGQLQARINQNK